MKLAVSAASLTPPPENQVWQSQPDKSVDPGDFSCSQPADNKANNKTQDDNWIATTEDIVTMVSSGSTKIYIT